MGMFRTSSDVLFPRDGGCDHTKAATPNCFSVLDQAHTRTSCTANDPSLTMIAFFLKIV